jgi:cytochrome c
MIGFYSGGSMKGSVTNVGRTANLGVKALALAALAMSGLGIGPGSGTAGAQTNVGAPGVDAAVAQSPEYKRGRLLYIQCRACHDLQPSPVEKVGPNLAGVVGRGAAQAPGFSYSPAMRGAKLVWDKATLDRWIEKPSAVVPGNIMAFAGIANPADRAALLRYIEIESAPR